jgi:membrane fusion protein, heavy metal efflux system
MTSLSATLRSTPLVIVFVLALAARGIAGDEHAEPGQHAGHDEQGQHAEHDEHDEHEKPDAKEEHDEHEAHAEHEEGGHFDVEDFERAGVTLATAGPGVVDFAIELPGEVRPNADRTAHVAARFPGTVREVRVNAGDQVRTGEVLAVIESDTLARYELRAAFDGTVVDKHVALGEVADRETPAFVIADLSTVWVDISVYQEDLTRVRPGRMVRIKAGDDLGEAEASISYVSPIVDQGTRTAMARTVLPNSSGAWRPGMFVTAHVLDPLDAKIAVPRTALQRHDGRSVVYVVHGDAFETRQVTVGRVGRTIAEISAGLDAGDRYAATGSFLIKAELEKGEAGGHQH